MEELLHCRAMEAECRQRAMYDTQNGWEWLANAEKWHHLANLEIISHFEDCNITKPNAA
jgi:hypothetical protein